MLVIWDSASYLMNSEIAILFRRSTIKYSFQKNLLLLCLPERIVVIEKKNSGFLWQEFMKLRFCSQYLRLNILSRRTLCFIARWKELSLLSNRNLGAINCPGRYTKIVGLHWTKKISSSGKGSIVTYKSTRLLQFLHHIFAVYISILSEYQV